MAKTKTRNEGHEPTGKGQEARSEGNGKVNGRANGAIEETAVIAPAPEYDWSQPISSPLKRYPGTVSFPEHFTMHHYRAWKEANEVLQALEDKGKEANEKDKGIGEFQALSISYGGPRIARQFDCRQWAAVLLLVDIRLENLPEQALKDTSGESTPLEVLAWLISLTLDTYIGEKLNLKN
jgi:hypothetical protein